MRFSFLPLVLVSAMGFAGVATAGTTAATTTTMATPAKAAIAKAAVAVPVKDTSGTITKIDAKGLYVVLSDGVRYHIAKGTSIKDFKVGEKVAISYKLMGKHHDVISIKAA